MFAVKHSLIFYFVKDETGFNYNFKRHGRTEVSNYLVIDFPANHLWHETAIYTGLMKLQKCVESNWQDVLRLNDSNHAIFVNCLHCQRKIQYFHGIKWIVCYYITVWNIQSSFNDVHIIVKSFFRKKNLPELFI